MGRKLLSVHNIRSGEVKDYADLVEDASSTFKDRRDHNYTKKYLELGVLRGRYQARRNVVCDAETQRKGS